MANVSCQGYDPVTRAEVPRRFRSPRCLQKLRCLLSSSLVRSLEDQVARLESQVLSFGKDPQNLAYIVASKIGQSTLSVGQAPSRSFFHSKLSPALFLHSSCPPLAVIRERSSISVPARRFPPEPKDSAPRPHSIPVKSINLNSIPAAAMKRMIQNYTDIHLPQYPVITASWLETVLEKVLHEQDGDTDSVLTYGISPSSGLSHFEYFVVFIVLAISSFTLTWRADLQARAASDSFCSSALKHLELMSEVDEIESLQVSLLLAHYAHMNPGKADNWTCIAHAVKIVLDLGLHKRCTEGTDEEQAKLRRRLFWVAYGMERSLCGLLRLPLSFPEESITTEVCSFSIISKAQADRFPLAGYSVRGVHRPRPFYK